MPAACLPTGYAYKPRLGNTGVRLCMHLPTGFRMSLGLLAAMGRDRARLGKGLGSSMVLSEQASAHSTDHQIVEYEQLPERFPNASP